MAKPLNYSKWDHIEISDDEDDTHPNIDTASLFRWRHNARVERMEQSSKEKQELKNAKTKHEQQLEDMKKKVKEAEESEATEELEKMKISLSELEQQENSYKKKESELEKKEKMAPLNIDTICKDGMSKTIINKSTKAKTAEMTEEDRLQKQQQFQDKNEKLIKKFGMTRRYEDSQTLLMDHPELTCEETANYLVMWCINLQMEDKSDLMDHVAHQTIVMQFILELAKSLDMDPRSCVQAFFSRIKMAEKQYMEAFNDELNSFKDRVRTRAKVRLDEAMEQVEENERQERLGPGGLDPIEVFQSLPEEMQKCFESKDIGSLQDVIAKMDPKDAAHHMQRCVDSGMWLADGGKADDGASEESEPIYQEIPETTESPEK